MALGLNKKQQKKTQEVNAKAQKCCEIALPTIATRGRLTFTIDLVSKS